MLEQATENTPIPASRPMAASAARFARDPAEFNPQPRLRLVRNVPDGTGDDNEKETR